jgi:polyisoprenoid-binding protein YceI
MRRRAFTGLASRLASRLAAALAAALLSAATIHAETYVLKLDPDATRVQFLVDAFLHKVHGSATLERGEITFDDASGAAQGEVVVDATAAQTGNEKRDRDMHVKVLESEEYPDIVLVVDGYEGRFDPSAPSEVVVTARLRLHGDEHPLRLEMVLRPDGAAGAKRLTATTTFVVPYVEWKMRDPSKTFLRVGKEVEVTIEAVGDLATPD